MTKVTNVALDGKEIIYDVPNYVPGEVESELALTRAIYEKEGIFTFGKDSFPTLFKACEKDPSQRKDLEKIVAILTKKSVVDK